MPSPKVHLPGWPPPSPLKPPAEAQPSVAQPSLQPWPLSAPSCGERPAGREGARDVQPPPPPAERPRDGRPRGGGARPPPRRSPRPHPPPRLSRCFPAPPSGSAVFRGWPESGLCPAASGTPDRLLRPPPAAAPACGRAATRQQHSGARPLAVERRRPGRWVRAPAPGTGVSEGAPSQAQGSGDAKELVCVRARGKVCDLNAERWRRARPTPRQASTRKTAAATPIRSDSCPAPRPRNPSDPLRRRVLLSGRRLSEAERAGSPGSLAGARGQNQRGSGTLPSQC